MNDVNGREIQAGDKVVHTTPSGYGGRSTALRFGHVKSVREKTCTVTASEEETDYSDPQRRTYMKDVSRVCQKEERVMVIESNGVYLQGEEA